ncbi:unnamed protein product [Protopolystoma xenopodis]|uniref:Uncharacterized protein n=1 Tax=Protopolystoma xenopodis TaxID=117903 RepID=A0A3S5CJ15_9PLAT|nr:unnamed protein product [Protopolystoma xenopodis]
MLRQRTSMIYEKPEPLLPSHLNHVGSSGQDASPLVDTSYRTTRKLLSCLRLLTTAPNTDCVSATNS